MQFCLAFTFRFRYPDNSVKEIVKASCTVYVFS